jgi:2,3-bisphosphoglycerate-dependent phosphoglycerate mutase
MQLYFIRHAQSQNNALWNRQGDYSGRSEDPSLTKVGMQQAVLLADYLAREGSTEAHTPRDMQNITGFGLTHLYTSLMVRAVETSIVAARTLNLPLIAWVDLHEGGGIYLEDQGELVGLPGKGRSFFQAHYPELRLPDWLGESGWWNKPFESRAQRRQRARRVLNELLQRHGNASDRVAFFSHGGFYNHFLAVLLNLGDQGGAQPSQSSVQELKSENVILSGLTGVWFEINNTAISRFEFSDDEVKLDYHNRVTHLPVELIT